MSVLNVAQGCYGDKVQYRLARSTAATEYIQVVNVRRAILPMGGRLRGAKGGKRHGKVEDIL